MKINGKEIADTIFQDLKKRVENLKKKNIIPYLAIILIGDDPASNAYVARKILKAKELQAASKVYRYPAAASELKILRLLEKLNTDKNVHGIIVQRPLPKHIDSESINENTNPKKDIDAFRSDSPYEMPLPAAVLEILKHIYSPISSDFSNPSASFLIWLKSKQIVVIGKGETGGGPTIQLLKKMGIKPQIIDSKTQNPHLITKQADILISTVGKPTVLKTEMIKSGAILISVGMFRGTDGKMHGDYNEDDIKEKALFYTPVPGGVGPINVAMLLKNLVVAAEN